MNNILRQHAGEIGRALRNHKYEQTDTGVFIPSMGLDIGGVFHITTSAGADFKAKNRVVTEGRNYVLNAAIRGASQISSWYVALFANNLAVVDGVNASNFNATQNEFTNYTEATRVAYVTDAASTASKLVNEAAPAKFTFDTGGGTVYGAALLSAATKESTSGSLFCAALFPDGQTLGTGGILNARYELTAQDGTPP